MEDIALPIINFLMNLSMQFPIITTILAILYGLGLLFEALSAAIEKYVFTTPSKDDDSWWSKVKESKIYKFVKTLLAFFLRLKLK